MSDGIEQWRPIAAFEGHYEASSLGQIRSRKNGSCRILKQRWTGRYLVVMISMYGKWRPYGVHRLVAMAFHGDPPNESAHACHYDGDATNNRVDNIRWDTPKGNADDMRRHNRHRNGRKTHCKNGHEFTPENTYVQPSKPGARRCLTCRDEYWVSWSRKNIKTVS